MKGYIKDYRKELESDIWQMPPLYHRVWQYLKYMVNHDENTIPMRDGTKFQISKGQHLTSVRDIAKNVGWYEGLKWKEPNPKTISVILDWLEKQGMISIERGKGNRQYTLISLINWEKYQISEVKGNNKVTEEKHLTDINKNDQECFKNDIAVVDIGADSEQEGMPTTQSDSESESKKISSLEYAEAIKNKYLQRRGKGFDLTPKDELALAEIMKERVPLRIALDGIDKSFKEFKPRHGRDEIRSLDYCVPLIFDLFVANKAKEGLKPKSFTKKATVHPIKPQTEIDDREYQELLNQMKTNDKAVNS